MPSSQGNCSSELTRDDALWLQRYVPVLYRMMIRVRTYSSIASQDDRPTPSLCVGALEARARRNGGKL
jgi:hypothetical protein